MKMSDKTYDALKWIQKIFVLLATFYDDLAGIWGLPYGMQISKTCLAVAAILLGILELASARYNKEMVGVQSISDELEGEVWNEEGVG